MVIEDFQKLTVSLRGNLDVKTNIIVFTFKGQLDAFSEKQFKNFVTNNLKNELPFVIDLTKIDFLDSSGLGALVQTAKECKKLKLGFSVVGNSRVAQTIKLVRLGDFLNLNSSLEDAFTYLKKLNYWIQNLLPYGSPEEIGVIQLAWLGDSVWELHQRLRHVHFPLKSKELHLSVVNEVKAKSQSKSLSQIEHLLNENEIDLIRRARNKTKRYPKSSDPTIYSRATGFETLIGWLFLKDPQRLSTLFEYLEIKIH